jgi:hypothetical protein
MGELWRGVNSTKLATELVIYSTSSRPSRGRKKQV